MRFKLFFNEAGDKVDLQEIEGLTIHDDAEKEILSKEVSWTISGKQGEYELIFLHEGTEYTKELIITKSKFYAPVEKTFKKSNLNKLVLGNERILPFANIPVLKDIPWVSGWGWLGAYFLFSLAFSIGLRRVFKIY